MQAEYIDHMGNDGRVVDAARVSMKKEASNFTTEKNNKLIEYLSKNGHWTPSSHPMVTMRETVPVFVARQRFKHMIGFTYNEVSRRYVDDEPEFFYPNMWRSRPKDSIKQGSGSNEVNRIRRKEKLHGNTIAVSCSVKEEYIKLAKAALELYVDMVEGGVAPEQARMVLPQSMYTSYYVTGSLAAWARAYNQRIHTHAQKEIQDLAKQWGSIMSPIFPESWKALTV